MRSKIADNVDWIKTSWTICSICWVVYWQAKVSNPFKSTNGERERKKKKKEKITVDCCCGCRELASSFFAWPCFQDSSMNRPRTGARKVIFKILFSFLFLLFFTMCRSCDLSNFDLFCVWLGAHSKQVNKKRHFSLHYVYLVGCETCRYLALTGKSQFPPTEPTSERNSDQKDGWLLLRVLD